MTKRAVRVLAKDHEWEVRNEGSKKPLRIVKTQAEAIQIGRRIAMNRGCELIVERPDGSIRSKDSFGQDPFPPTPG